MKDTILERLKSPVVWGVVIAQIVLIAGAINPAIAVPVKVIGGAILEIATAFGVLNNPTDRGGF